MIRVGLINAVFLSFLFLVAAADDARPPKPEASPAEESARLLAIGRDLFVARCGRCHDADGSKPLADGPPLNRRKVPADRLARMVDSRLKDATEEQRRAVKLHITSFMKN
ncbi:MAG TPA: cytochrome c [Terriglobales bacterium]|nr:cytochrome c [Terriglobales bacterium]